MSRAWEVEIADEFQPEFDRLQEDVQDAILAMSASCNSSGRNWGGLRWTR